MFNSKSFPTIALLVLLPAISTATPQACCHKFFIPSRTIPALSNNCANLTGGFTFLNKEISSAEVPSGIVCTFFQDFGCASGPGDDPNDGKIVLWEGTWNIPVKNGAVNFNDLI
ncbi:hypothetical protein DFH09DRAFT_1068614 [Mycena vulgaris]|nr:hypothetical protein DFH09DRAFT_1068614 [Mycena vulgaris]